MRVYLSQSSAPFWRIMSQEVRIMQINFAILRILSEKFQGFNLLTLQIFFGFTFNTNLPIFKAKA